MNILLTNDDGVHSKGINSLYDVLSRSNSVYIVAPDKEKSACSNAITVRENLNIEILSENRYAVGGFPADCVNIGLHGDILPEIDLVISGINHGPNLGEDVFFSGTVAGARTAMIFGVTGIAFSLDCLGDSDYFDSASHFILKFITEESSLTGSSAACYNINYPDIPDNEIRGVKYTFLGKRNYRDSYRILDRNENSLKVQLNGTIESEEMEGCDVSEVRKGFISITPLHLDCTDYEHLNKFSRSEKSWLK